MLIRSLLLAVTILALCVPSNSSAQNQPTFIINFVVAHLPTNTANLNVFHEFAGRVSNATGGRIRINIISAFNSFDYLDELDYYAVKRVQDGSMNMSQVSIESLAKISPSVQSLLAPMVFQNHSHVKKTINGDIGLELRQKILDDSEGKIVPLAFSYGGFKNFYTTGEQDSVAELRGMVTRAPRGNPIRRETVKNLGVEPSENLKRNWEKAHKDKKVLMEEADINQIVHERTATPSLLDNIKNILLTEHSVSMSAIIIQGPLIASITQEYSALIQKEVEWLAEKQEELFVMQSIQAKGFLQNKGIRFVEISDEDNKQLQIMADKVYADYKNGIVGEYIEKIRDVK